MNVPSEPTAGVGYLAQPGNHEDVSPYANRLENFGR